MPTQIPDWLFAPAPGTPSAWYVGLAAVYAALLGGSLLAYVFRRDLVPGKSLQLRLISRLAKIGAAFGGLGVALLLARFLGVPGLSMRVWLVLVTLALLAFVAYAGYFYRARYPALSAAQKVEEARFRYIRPATSGGGRRRSKRRRR